MEIRGLRRWVRSSVAVLTETGSAEAGQACLCGHEECQPPTKAEGFMAVSELAPEGRFVERPTRDW